MSQKYCARLASAFSDPWFKGQIASVQAYPVAANNTTAANRPPKSIGFRFLGIDSLIPYAAAPKTHADRRPPL